MSNSEGEERAAPDSSAPNEAEGFDQPGRTASPLTGLRHLFHRLTNVVPDEQEVVSVSPDISCAEALNLLEERGFSQVPIVRNGVVLGSFSFRSFALGAVMYSGRLPLVDVPVEEFREDLDTAHPSEELIAIFQSLDRDGAVLIGDVEDLLGLVTPMDVLNYLYRVAEPYVQLGEVERSLREIVSRSIESEQMEACAGVALADQYAGREDDMPLRPDEMTLGDLVSVIRHGDNYEHFAAILGTQRALVTPRLNRLPTLRNVAFHFRRDLTGEEREQLRETRNWLLRKLWGRA